MPMRLKYLAITVALTSACSTSNPNKGKPPTDQDTPYNPFEGVAAGLLAAHITASREVARVPADDAPASDSESILSPGTNNTITAWRWRVSNAETGAQVFTSEQASPTFTCPAGRAAFDVRLDITDGLVTSAFFERRLITCVLPRTANGRAVVDVNIESGAYFQRGQIGGQTVPPGALIRVSGSNTGNNMAFFNFQGTPQAPIHIINSGLVEHFDASWGLFLINCQNVIVDGFGDDNVPYGFVVDNSTTDGAQAVWVRFYTQGDNTLAPPTGIEIYGVHVRQSPGTGLQVSTDGSEAFNRNNWTHNNLRIHHNRVEDAGDEGFYIGYFTDGVSPAPHKMVNSRIYRNHIERTGWDGLQVSNSDGLEVHHNVVIDSGREGEANQRSTLQVNPGNRNAFFFRNQLLNTIEGGVDVQVGCTGGNMTFFGNTFVSPAGAYVHGGASDGPTLRFVHNTFVLEDTAAIRLNRNGAPASCAGSGSTAQRIDAVYNLALLPSGEPFFDVVAGTDSSASWTLAPNLVAAPSDVAALCLSAGDSNTPYVPTCSTSSALADPGSALTALSASAQSFPGGVLTDATGRVLNDVHGFGAFSTEAP